MTKLPTLRRCFFLGALLAGFFATGFATEIDGQVMTNRTPDKVKIQPQATPRPTPSSNLPSTIIADPVLSRPGTPPPQTLELDSVQAYYVWLSGVNRVLVSDSSGRTDDLFRAGTRKQISDATYEFLGPHTRTIILPVGETYTITFESADPAMVLEILRGRGDVSPEEAIRHNDLVLDNGTVQFQVSATGVSPLRLDSNRDGRFERILEPTAHVRGLAAKDKRGPEITFEILERDGDTVLVAIKAVDKETGVKSIYYSTDGVYDFPYEHPVRVNLKQSKFIHGVADDNAGNRAVTIHKFDKP
jgi:hypothetical protein